MPAHPYHPQQWKKLIPDIDQVIDRMEDALLVSIGITPYTRIIPAFFLKTYSTYVPRRSSDVDVLETFARMHVLEDHDPKLSKKVHSTGYLLNSYAFKNFLKSRRNPVTLMINTVTDKAAETLKALGVSWIGNTPTTFESVMNKGPFRKLVKDLGLVSMPTNTYMRDAYLSSSFEDLLETYGGSFVVQRGDKEVGGNEGTFFIHTAEDFSRSVVALAADESFEEVIISPFIKGYSTSMLGCVLPEGTLSGPLQLQLIDVPESLHGVPPSGIFFGNDIGFHPWGDHIEKQAQEVIEGIGAHLREQDYRGIFGIDFMYDENRDCIYPNECNPRFTGSLVLHSLSLLESGTPPLEFFHLLSQLNIEATFDFEEVNRALKVRQPFSHIALSPKDIHRMGLPFLAGIYEYDSSIPDISYVGPGFSLADLKNERQFLLIDTVPTVGTEIEQSVPRLLKFIFPRSIAQSSHAIDADAAFLLERFSGALLVASKQPEE